MRAAALLLVMFAAPASAPDPQVVAMREWIAAVDAHRLGEHDAALDRIGAWSFDQLDRNIRAIDVLVNPSSGRTVGRLAYTNSAIGAEIEKIGRDLRERTDINTFRKRAALFHTDSALMISSPIVVGRLPPASAGRRSYDTRRVDVLSSDGQVERYQISNPHWDYARLLLRSIPARPQRDPIVARWYRAVGSYFIFHRLFADARDHFEEAADVVPDDPDVLYGRACLQEIFGAPRIQDYVRIARQTGVSILDVTTPRSHFRRAEGMLRQALGARPDFPEAHLRLGKVLAELDDRDEALTHWQQVLASTKDAGLSYYAHLFTADVMLSLDRAEDARAAYEHALDLFPSSQAAHLGLGAALRMMGDRTGALAAVLETATVPPNTRDQSHEPWWNYYDGDEIDVEFLLGQLRESVK